MVAHFVVPYEQVILAHEISLQNGGGLTGIKNENDIRSALGRPYQEFNGFIPYPTVVDKGGCLLHSLLNCHGFNDANVRLG